MDFMRVDAPSREDDFLTQERDRAAFCQAMRAHQHVPKLCGVFARCSDAMAAAALWQQSLERLGTAEVTTQPWGAPSIPTHKLVAIGDMPWPDGIGEPVYRVAWDKEPTSQLLERVACTSAWTWELCCALTGVEDLLWLAALGCIERAVRAPVSWLTRARSRFTGKFLLQAATLLGAAARAPTTAGAIPVAMQALTQVESPRQFVAHPRVQLLHGLQADYDAILAQARHTMPYFCGRLAVYQLVSAHRVEDILVARWAAAHPQRVVLVGNQQDDHVTFVVRTRCGMNPADYLRSAGWTPPYDVAEGRMPLALWGELLRRLHVPQLAW